MLPTPVSPESSVARRVAPKQPAPVKVWLVTGDVGDEKSKVPSPSKSHSHVAMAPSSTAEPSKKALNGAGPEVADTVAVTLGKPGRGRGPSRTGLEEAQGIE